MSCDLIFGDNQFFGINHMSDWKALQQQIRFSSVDRIANLLEQVWQIGFRSFMFSTHAELGAILETLREREAPLVREGRFYPVIPYAHKYADLVAEKGVLRTVLDVSGPGKFRQMGQLARGLLRRDVGDLMKPLVDAELRVFSGLHLECVLLQNIVTDLVLGVGRGDLLVKFRRYVEVAYGCRAGFITMNPALLQTSLAKNGDREAPLCLSLNSTGYLMNPSREEVERAVRDHAGPVIVMNVLAGGAVGPGEAARYLAEFRKGGGRLGGIVYGASTVAHAQEMRECLLAAGLCRKDTT